MFDSYREPTGSAALAETIEPGRYGVKLIRFEDDGVSSYADPNDANPAHRIRWVFHLYPTGSNTPLVDADGREYEHFEWTSSRTGPKSSARPWIEALLGRPMQPGDGGQELTEKLVGGKAWALLDHVTTPGTNGSEPRTRLKILSLSPIVRGQKPGTAAAPKPVPAPVAQEEAFAA